MYCGVKFMPIPIVILKRKKLIANKDKYDSCFPHRVWNDIDNNRPIMVDLIWI